MSVTRPSWLARHVILGALSPTPAHPWAASSARNSHTWRQKPQPSRRSRARARASARPSSGGEVVRWAEEAFAAELSQPEAASEVPMAKLSMLISLEEEAALQQMYEEAEGSRPAGLRTATSASTWSLERLEGLAAQIGALFYTRCQELGVADELQAAAQSGASDERLLELHLGLVRLYPVQLLGAVNEVVFGQQGYTKRARHGDPRDSLLSTVLESGRGSPAALAILYREVCARLGLPLHAAVLEGGGYLVLWPADPAVQLAAGGEQLVVDPYAGGALYTLEEVCMLFDVEGEGGLGLQPASGRQILAALLKGLMDSHWCRSLGCSPEPALMVPPSLDLALGGSNSSSSSSSGQGSMSTEGSSSEGSSSLSSETGFNGGDGSERAPPGLEVSSSEAAASASSEQPPAADPPQRSLCRDGPSSSSSSSSTSAEPASNEGSSSSSSGGAEAAADPPAQRRQRGPQAGTSGRGWPAQGPHLERALAAAKKRALLLPECRSARLDYALLLYFAQQYSAARQELDALLQPPAFQDVPEAAAGMGGRCPQQSGWEGGWPAGQEGSVQGAERLQLLRQKCRLMELL